MVISCLGDHSWSYLRVQYWDHVAVCIFPAYSLQWVFQYCPWWSRPNSVSSEIRGFICKLSTLRKHFNDISAVTHLQTFIFFSNWSWLQVILQIQKLKKISHSLVTVKCDVFLMFGFKVKFYRSGMNKYNLIGDACSWIEAHHATVTLIEVLLFFYLFFYSTYCATQIQICLFWNTRMSVCVVFSNIWCLCVCVLQSSNKE